MSELPSRLLNECTKMSRLFRTVNLNRDRWGSDSENSEAGTDRSSLSRDSARVLSQASASSKLANVACSEGENASRRRYPLINGCRSVNIFERLDRARQCICAFSRCVRKIVRRHRRRILRHCLPGA